MLPKPRLLIVANNIGYRLSGGDYHILRVIKEWEKRVDVTMLASKLFASSNDYLPPNKVHVKDPIPYLDVANTYLYMIIAMVRAFFLIFSRSEESYEVIVAPSHYIIHLLPCVFLKLRNKNALLVVYCHGVLIPTNNAMRLLLSTTHNLLGLSLVRLSADLVFVINESVKERCLDFGIQKEKIVITSNAVDVISSVGDVGSGDAKTFAACFLGRIDRCKGVYDLMSIWKLICCKLPNATLAIIGEGSDKGRIEKLSIKMGLEHNVTFFGFISEDEKYRVLKNSEIFISPSYLESWGISVAEAMACGLPAVTYNLPAYKAVFEDKLVIVPLGNVDAMVKRVEFLLENPEAARKIGEEGREFVKRYDWSIVAKRELSEITALKGRAYGR